MRVQFGLTLITGGISVEKRFLSSFFFVLFVLFVAFVVKHLVAAGGRSRFFRGSISRLQATA
jgi:hypothetical protein